MHSILTVKTQTHPKNLFSWKIPEHLALEELPEQKKINTMEQDLSSSPDFMLGKQALSDSKDNTILLAATQASEYPVLNSSQEE